MIGKILGIFIIIWFVGVFYTLYIWENPEKAFCIENGYDDSRSPTFRNSYCIKLVNDTLVTKDYHYYNGSYYWVGE